MYCGDPHRVDDLAKYCNGIGGYPDTITYQSETINLYEYKYLTSEGNIDTLIVPNCEFFG